jgi:hypothetical protein
MKDEARQEGLVGFQDKPTPTILRQTFRIRRIRSMLSGLARDTSAA